MKVYQINKIEMEPNVKKSKVKMCGHVVFFEQKKKKNKHLMHLQIMKY